MENWGKNKMYMEKMIKLENLPQNRINTYGYAVYRGKDGKPLHVVEICHNMLASFRTFSNAMAAIDFINMEKASLGKFANLSYNPDFVFTENLLKYYVNGGFENA